MEKASPSFAMHMWRRAGHDSICELPALYWRRTETRGRRFYWRLQNSNI